MRFTTAVKKKLPEQEPWTAPGYKKERLLVKRMWLRQSDNNSFVTFRPGDCGPHSGPAHHPWAYDESVLEMAASSGGTYNAPDPGQVHTECGWKRDATRNL